MITAGEYLPFCNFLKAMFLLLRKATKFRETRRILNLVLRLFSVRKPSLMMLLMRLLSHSREGSRLVSNAVTIHTALSIVEKLK